MQFKAPIQNPPCFPAGGTHVYGSDVSISGMTTFVDNLALRFGGESGKARSWICISTRVCEHVGLLQQLVKY